MITTQSTRLIQDAFVPAEACNFTVTEDRYGAILLYDALASGLVDDISTPGLYVHIVESAASKPRPIPTGGLFVTRHHKTVYNFLGIYLVTKPGVI